MTNILFIYENEMPTVSIMQSFWSGLSEKYGIFVRFLRLLNISSADIDRCDVLFLIRPNNAYAWKIAKKSRSIGKFVITVCDDDLLNLPKTYPDLPWQRKGLIKALNNSDVFVSSSRYLIDKMTKYTSGKRGVYIDTVVRPEEILNRSYDLPESTVKIVYAAGSQHEKVFVDLVLPALKQVAAQLPGKFSLTFVSVHPRCDGLEESIPVSYIKGMPLNEYRRYMEEQKFDIGISPLENNEFSKCKYFNKYLEYTLSGAAGVYSNVEPYTYVVKDGYNGLLADNTTDSWAQKLSLLIKNSEIRISCAKNAAKHVMENFNEDSIIKHIFTEIPEICAPHLDGGRKCPGLVIQKAQYRIVLFIEYAYKMYFYIKNEGVKSVFNKILMRFK